MQKLTVKDLDLKGKKVLIRVDFNVPLDEKGNITDDIRIQAAVPTLKYILDQEPQKLIIMSHLGRPKGKVVEEMRLTPASDHLQKLLNEAVLQLDDCVGPEVESAIADAKERVIVLENLRFHEEETNNDDAFAKKLASLGDVYVNDAFGTAHRAHASTEGVTKYLTSAAGLLLNKEIEFLGQVVDNPEKPLVVILGGAKVSDKIKLVENLITKADALLISGGMAYTFLKAQGKEIGNSLCQEDFIDQAKELLEKAKAAGVEIALSQDFVISDAFDKPEHRKTVEDIPQGWEGLDIGPKTIEKYKEILSKAKTVVWNGPVGVFEIEGYDEGTKAIAQYLATLDAKTIIGGGDSAAAAKKFGVADKMTHISTGGGASLEMLEGKKLPGIEALTDNAKAGA